MEGSHHYFTLAPAELASHSFPAILRVKHSLDNSKTKSKNVGRNKNSGEVKHLPLDYHYSVRS
jgi:hypothetical protein